MADRRRYRGKWSKSKLTATLVAKLMRTSVSRAKRILHKLNETFGYVDEDLIGLAIQEVRNKRDLKVITNRGKKGKKA